MYGKNHINKITYGNMKSDLEEFEPAQRIDRPQDIQDRAQIIQDFKSEANEDFQEAIQLPLTTKAAQRRQTIFQLARDHSETKMKVHTRRAVQLGKESPLKKRFVNLKERYGKKTILNTSMDFLEMLSPMSTKKATSALDGDVSALYIPKAKRIMMGGPAMVKKRQEEELLRKKEEDAKKVTFDLDQVLRDMEAQQAREAMERKKKAKQVYLEEKKKKKPKRRASFSEGMCKYDDVANLLNPLRETKINSITIKDAHTITEMQKHGRYPVPEVLLALPDKYHLFIDSIITEAWAADEWADRLNYRQEVKAPENSYDSLEEIDFASEEEEPEPEVIPEAPKKKKRKRGEEEVKKVTKVNQATLKMHGFEPDILRAYPHGVREGYFPALVLRLDLNEDVTNLEKKVLKPISKEFKERKLFPTIAHVQYIYELQCKDFNVPPWEITEYFKKGVLAIKKTIIPVSQVKALCTVIPLLQGLKHVHLNNNALQDEMIAIIIMACFMNPDVQILTIINNFIGATTGVTFLHLWDNNKDKFHELNIQGSIANGEHAEYFINTKLFQSNSLATLSVQNIAISFHSCKNIGHYLINSFVMRDLNVQNCKISNQGTRYVIDGIRRNKGLQYFNFASNVLASLEYEFSSQIAQILQRHQYIMHLDITGTGLKTEEILFIGMAMSTSKSVIAVHMTANNLDYYQRIYLRTLVDAKVAYHFRNMAVEEGSIRSQRERSQILELKNHDFDEGNLKDFLTQWNYIDQQRLGLDDEINQILKEVDITEIFKNLKKGNKGALETENLIQDLVEKIEERKESLAQMKITQSTEMNKESDDGGVFDINAPETLTNFKEMGLYNFDKEGNVPKTVTHKITGEIQEEDLYALQGQYKIQRIRKQLEAAKAKQARAKSAGELALMFMGINKIAYDLLLENPMTGYMNEVIFTRLLGQDEVDNAEQWKDCSQCFVCEKWDKVNITYNERDTGTMVQSTSKLSQLHHVLKECVDLGVQKLIKKVPETEVRRMYEDDEEPGEDFGADMLDGQKEEEDGQDMISLETAFEDKIDTESLHSLIEEAQFQDQDLDVGNTINTVKVDKYQLCKQLPKNVQLKEDLGIPDTPSEHQMSDESDIKEYEKLKTPVYVPGQYKRHREEMNANEIKSKSNSRSGRAGSQQDKDEVESQLRSLKGSQMSGADVAKLIPAGIGDLPIIPEEKKQYKKVKKSIYYQGQVFLIEEEISLDSRDLNKSAGTSEDSFEYDDGIQFEVTGQVDEGQRNRTKEKKLQVEQLQKVLERNRPIIDMNLFRRQLIYIVASFNDWQPCGLTTFFEIKMRKKYPGWELEDFVTRTMAGKDADQQCKSKKKEENVAGYVNYVPPGKHFFYFIYQDKHVFLSPRYDIVRFKGTNVFLNTFKVKERTGELQQVTLNRSYAVIEAARFNKDKSVWKTYSEDTDDMLVKMLDQDLLYGKVHKLVRKGSTEMPDIRETLLKHYLHLKNIFLLVACNSSYPTIGLNDFTEFCRVSKIFDKNVNLATVDRKFINTNQSNNKYKNSAERDLHRYEFVEVIARLAISKYHEPKIVDWIAEAIDKLLTEDVIPRNQSLDGLGFRNTHMYNLKVDEVFKKNAAVISKMYESHLTPNKRYISLEECQKLLKKANLKINDYKISPCYVESMMSRIDTMSDLSVLQQMKYVEFIVFIARVSFEVYKGTKQEKKPLHIKIDKVLESILDTFDLKKTFNVPDAADDDEEESSSSEDQDSKKDSDRDEDD